MSEPSREWTELPASEWSRAQAAHLLRRAGFGGTPGDVDEATRRGLDDTLRWMFEAAAARPDPVDEALRALGAALPYDEVQSLQGAWVHRMIHAASPLRERLTLYWHGHFATGQQKVANANWMRSQVELLRAQALGPFGELLRAIARDPAMLRWLDGESNTQGAPNENFARELFELFSLGVGHYTEADVREAARAFTGYRIRDGRFAFDPAEHDAGLKHVLGRIGALGGDDVISRVLEQPACGRFLATKLFEHFAFAAPPPALLEPFAERLRRDDYRLRGALELLFRSRLFYSPRCQLAHIKSPAEYAIGAVLALGARVPPYAVAEAMAEMGQKLYFPPSVKGWTGGRAWISSTALFARQKFARSLVNAKGDTLGWATDLEGPLYAAGVPGNDAARVAFYLDRLLPGQATGEVQGRLVRYLAGASGPLRQRLAETVHLILSLPEYQLA